MNIQDTQSVPGVCWAKTINTGRVTFGLCVHKRTRGGGGGWERDRATVEEAPALSSGPGVGIPGRRPASVALPVV